MASSSVLNVKPSTNNNVKRAFSNEVESDYNDLQPFFLESSDEENASFYDSSIAIPQCWQKFDLLTYSNSGSPMKECVTSCDDGDEQPRNFGSSVGNAAENVLNVNVDISGILKRMRTESLTGSQAQLILREDFMWSAPGLQALGLDKKGSSPGSTGSKAGEKLQQPQEQPQQPVQMMAASLIDVISRATPRVDAVPVFMATEIVSKETIDSDDDYDGSDERSMTRSVNVKVEEGDDTDEGDYDSDEDDDDEEVDVVSLNKGQQQQELRFQTSAAAAVAVPYRRRSAGDPSPSSAVITADVAAMHNYSNRSSGPTSQPQVSLPAGGGGGAGGGAGGTKRPAAAPPARSTSLLVKRPRLSAPSSPVAASEQPSPSWRPHPRHSASSSKASLRHHHHHHHSHGYHAHHSHHQGGGCQRRELHNVLERKRRDDLRGNFNGLRDLLPNVQAKERMPKVTILRRSCDFIRSLRRTFHDLSAEMHRLRQRQGDLRARLRDLGGDAAVAMATAASSDDDEEDCAVAHWG